MGFCLLWVLSSSVQPLHAQEADSARVAGLQRAPAAADSARRPNPRGALLRSVLLPGWGQYYNGKAHKGIFFSTVAAGFLTAAVIEVHRVGQANTPGATQDRVTQRNRRFLYFFITTAMAALDAYVDAQLSDFEVDTQVRAAPHGVELQIKVAWER